MGYQEIMQSTAEVVQDAGVATKIIQHMDRIRNNKSVESARRWVWELIQNAKDVARDESPVNIHLALTEDQVVFSHDGKPFRVRNVLSIINQISSKTNDESSTGMFGTGFITTHQLSEVVTLKSVIQDSLEVGGEVQQLPYKNFQVILDRSGENIDDITTSVKKSLDVIRNIDQYPDVDYVPEDFNTQLTYALKTEESKEIAKKGLTDLKYSVFYALIFVEGIATISYEDKVTGEKMCYKKGEVTELSGDVSQYILYGNEEKFRFLVTKNEKTVIAIPVEAEENALLELDDDTPKLYVDFPLVGAESFPLPFICHSRGLHPAEKRDWIPISMNDTTISNHNKAIMEETVTLYGNLLDYVTQEKYLGIPFLARILPIPVRDDLHQEWFEENVHLPLIDHLLARKIFRVDGVNQEMTKEFLLPFSMKKPEESVKIAVALGMLEGYQVVDQEVIAPWNEMLKKQPAKYRKKFHGISLEYVKENFLKGELQHKMKENHSFIAYIQALYHIMMEDEGIHGAILRDELAIFPNMYEPVELRTVKNIGDGATIPQEYIDIFEELDKEGYPNYNFKSGGRRVTEDVKFFSARKYLLHKEFSLGNYTPLVKKTLRGYISNFEKICEIDEKYNLSVPLPDSVFLKVATLRGDTAYLDLFRHIGNESQRKFLETISYDQVIGGDKEIFSQYYALMLRRLVKNLEGYGSLGAMELVLGRTESENLEDIQSLVQRLEEENRDKMLGEKKVLPNKTGTFCTSLTLYRNGDIHEAFLEIASMLQGLENSTLPAFRDILLHSSLFVKSVVQSHSNETVASKISHTVELLLSSGELQHQLDKHQEACALLLAWINDESEEAKKYFPNFASEEARMRLLSSKSASIMNRKLNTYQNMLKKFGLESVEDLEKALAALALEEKDDQEETYGDGHVFLGKDDEFFVGLHGEEKEDYIRRVGTTGEKIAFQTLVKSYMDLNYEVISESPTTCNLKLGEITVEIHAPDTDTYKQSGWDISVLTTENNQESKRYYEVKSTTARKRDNQFRLTNRQFNLALSVKERFSVFLVHLIPKTLEFHFLDLHENFFQSMQENEIACLNQEFYFTR